MTLKQQLSGLTDDNVICGVISRYLSTINPHRLSSVAVWKDRKQGYRCQSHIADEFYGHIFAINIENETLEPIIN